MNDSFMDFDAIMQPVGAERFFAEYFGRKPLYLKGAAERFDELMNWQRLNRLLEITTIWSRDSLGLYLDKERIPLGSYTEPAQGRDGIQVLRPVAEKVTALLRQGATLITNDIDQLTPELRSFAGVMEQALGGKVQANLYCSSRRRQGFAAHFDTHDVFAVQIEGEKTWHVYEGRAKDPIAHEMFKSLPQEHHEKAKGGKLEDVRMTRGDVLYLPRGQYHDALADDAGTVHIAFGVTYPIGIDIVGMLFDRMVADPLGRANLPTDEAALTRYLADIGQRIGEVLATPELLAHVKSAQANFSYSRPSYDLPAPMQPAESFRVRASGVRLIEQDGRHGLMREGSRQAVEVPAEVTAMVAWVLEREHFVRIELVTAFPQLTLPQTDRLLRDLEAMRLTEPA